METAIKIIAKANILLLGLLVIELFNVGEVKAIVCGSKNINVADGCEPAYSYPNCIQKSKPAVFTCTSTSVGGVESCWTQVWYENKCIKDDWAMTCKTDTATPVKSECGGVGGGTCGGTRGSCSGNCDPGSTCRAPSVLGNGDACTCHSNGTSTSGTTCDKANECRKDCTGNGISDKDPNLPGCGGCKSTQSCCLNSKVNCVTWYDGICAAIHNNCTQGVTGAFTEDGSYYYWFCDGINGGISNYCSEKKACTVIAPNVGGVVTTSTSAVLNWIPGSGGVQQLLRLDSSQSKVLNGDPTSKIFVTLPSGQSNYPLISGLTPNTVYYWTVVEYKSTTDFKDFGNSCNAISTQSFTTPLAAPVVSVSCVGSAATISWPAVTGATHYSIRVNNESNPWTGACPAVNPGDACFDQVQTSYTFNTTSAQTYTTWVHSGNSSSMSTASNAVSFICNTPPTFTNLTVKNSTAVIPLSWDVGNKAHICMVDFQNDISPRTAIFQATLTDVDGGIDIIEAKLRWNGTVYPMILSNIVGNTVKATAIITFTAAQNVTTNLPLSILYNDASGAGTGMGYTNTGYSWKAWNCTVPLNGNVYDASDSALGGQCPSGVGFVNLANTDMNFKSVDVITGGIKTIINASSVNAYSKSDALIWSKTYSIVPNSDLAGSGVITRWIDLGVGTTSCASPKTIDNSVVDPYSINPGVKVDFSAIRDQDSWYSIQGGSLLAAGTVANMIPITCSLNSSCTPAITSELTLGDLSNGIVSGAIISNNSGCLLDGSSCYFGKPKNWYKAGNILTSADKFSYQYFFDKYFSTLGLGLTISGDTTMSNILLSGGTGVVLVDGNLDVDVDNFLSVGKLLLVVVGGTINISENVNLSSGLFIADGNIIASGDSATQLIIEGSLYSSYSGGMIRLNRTYTSKTMNNTSPAVLVKYRPDLLFNMPGALTLILSSWKL